MPMKYRHNPRQLDGPEYDEVMRLGGEKGGEYCKARHDNLDEFITRYSPYILRHDMTDRLFAGFLGGDDTSWVFAGGSTFYVDEKLEVQYCDTFTIRRVQRTLWVVETIHDQPAHQEFRTLDEAVDVIWLVYGLPVGLEFLLETFKEIGFSGEIRDNGTILVLWTPTTKNDHVESMNVVKKEGLQYFLTTLNGKPYSRRRASRLADDEDTDNFSEMCSLLQSTFGWQIYKSGPYAT